MEVECAIGPQAAADWRQKGDAGDESNDTELDVKRELLLVRVAEEESVCVGRKNLAGLGIWARSYDGVWTCYFPDDLVAVSWTCRLLTMQITAFG
jgi:hypothetical protein